MNQTKKNAANNFGIYGWLTVLIGFLLFMIGAGIGTDFLNVSVGILSEQNGWNSAAVLSVSTISGWLTLVTSFLAGKLVEKIGARKVMLTSIVLMAICTFFIGSISRFWMYAVIMIIIGTLEVSQNGIAMSAVVASWFPKKKGLVMGWTTMGMCVSTVAFLPFFTLLTNKLGIGAAYRVIGIVVLVVAVLAFFCIRNTPEERGVAPDNDPNFSKEDLAAMEAHNREMMESCPWTLGQLLRTKQVWQIGYMMGASMMVCVGIMSQFMPRMMSMGFSLPQVISCMSLFTLLGIPFSYVWGILDVKLGTKIVVRILMVWFLLSTLLLVVVGANMVGIYVAITCLACAMGGSNNMLTSLTASVFGRYDFTAANRIIYPIYTALRCSAFAIVGIAVNYFGGYNAAYLLLAGILLVGVIVSFFTDDKCIGRQ